MSDRSSLNRRAALIRVSQIGGSAVAAPAQRAFMQRFYDQVDPNRELSADEREKRAGAARRAYFVDLGIRSSRKRRKASEVGELRRIAVEAAAAADELEQGA